MFQKPRKINGSSNVVLASDVFRMNLFLERQHPFNDKKSIKEKSNDMLVNESFHESVAKGIKLILCKIFKCRCIKLPFDVYFSVSVCTVFRFDAPGKCYFEDSS